MHLWYMAVLISDMLFSHSFYFTELYKRTWFVGVAGSAVVTPALLVWCFPMAANRSGEVKQLQTALGTVKRSHFCRAGNEHLKALTNSPSCTAG